MNWSVYQKESHSPTILIIHKSFQSYSQQKSWTLFGFCSLNVEIGYFSIIYVSVGNVNAVKITRHHLINSSNDCPALTIKIVLNPLHNICPPVKHPHWFLLDIISIKWWLALSNNREVDWRWITTGTSELTELPSLLFSVKHQQQRSGRVQPAGSPLGVGRGSDAKAEAGGEGLVRPGTATVQLPATVRLKCVCVWRAWYDASDVYFCLSNNQYVQRRSVCVCVVAHIESSHVLCRPEGCDCVCVCFRSVI